MPIGTTAAIIIGSLAAGGSAASNIYGARTAGKQNKRALEAGERSDVRADTRERERLAEEQRALDAQIAEKKRAEDEQLKLTREENARKERQYNEAVQRDRDRWQDYLRINEPMWRQGAGVLGSLYDIAGAGSAPQFQMPSQPPPMGGGGALPPGGGGAPTNPLPDPNRGPMQGGPGGIDPEGRWQNISRPMTQGRTFQMMPIPSDQGQSLQNLMQLAQLVEPSRMPKPQYTGDVGDLSQLMARPRA